MLCCILSAMASSTSFHTYVLTGGFPTNLSVGGSSISLFRRVYTPPFDSHLRAITRGSQAMSVGSLMRCGNLVPRSYTSVNSPKCFRLACGSFTTAPRYTHTTFLFITELLIFLKCKWRPRGEVLILFEKIWESKDFRWKLEISIKIEILLIT